MLIISYQKRRRKAGFFLIISESVLRHFANLKICVIMIMSILIPGWKKEVT